jgi:hypothetical protein
MNFQKLCFAVTVVATFIAICSTSSAACTNATMTGEWGYIVGAAVGQFNADGHGHITAGSQTVSQGGVIQTQTYTGTYSVTSHCTGSLTINFTGGGTAHANFVLDSMNKGAQVIDTDTGGVAAGFTLARGVVTCGLTGVKHTFAGAFVGKIPGVGGAAYLTQMTLDGNGNVTGSGTFDVNGAFRSGPISGTYTEASDCTGTLEILSGSNTYNFNFVVVNGGKEFILLQTNPGTAVGGYMLQ